VNKIDKADPLVLAELRHKLNDVVFVSSHTGEVIDELETRLELLLNSLYETVVFAIPFDRVDVVSRIHYLGTVTVEESHATGTVLTARVPKKLARELDAFRVKDREHDDLDVDGPVTS